MKINTIKKGLLFFVFFGLAFSMANIRVKAVVNISNSPATSSTSPRIAVDSQGNIHAIWVELSGSTTGDLFYSRGNRDATQWTTPVNLSNSNVVYCNSLMLCGIDVDASDRVYVIWADGNQIKLRIYSSGSWGNATVLASGLVFDAPKIAVTPGGDIFAIWWASSTYKIYSRARINGNWENTFEINTEGKGSKFPDIAVGNNSAGASWAEKNAALDIYQAAYVQRSRSWNAPWSSVALVAPGTLSQKHQMLQFDSNDVVHIIWTTELGGDRIVHYSYRAGSSFTSPVAISNTTLLHYPNLDERNDNLYACWQVGGYGGGSSIDYNNKIQGTWQGSQSVPGSSGSTFCDVAAAQNGEAIYFVWDSNGEIYVYVKNVQAPNPWISLTPNKLNYAATAGSTGTRSQYVYINHSGSGTKNWSATRDQSWIQVNPTSGTESGIIEVSVNPAGFGEGTYQGSIYVTDPNAPQYSPKTVTVTLRVYGSGATGSPFGYLDTPVDGTGGIEGSLPVTGWALDDIEVTKVDIWRDPVGGEPIPPNGYFYIGDAVFVWGARPDVESAYPSYPLNNRAGWGYMMLTNFLPNSGNGTFRIHAIAHDKEGRSYQIGTKTITCDNAHATLPFGAIDTPSQGGIVSGSSYVNFGWALTPMPKSIPTDGSTIWLWIDGQPVGHPTYNNYRVDIATLFPGYANANGAVGYYYLDTTKYTNWVHTIAWSVEDNAGKASGIGSRYFAVLNTGAGNTADLGVLAPFSLSLESRDNHISSIAELANIPTDYYSPVYVRKGYDLNSFPEPIFMDAKGAINIEAQEVDRIEIALRESADSESLVRRTRDREKPARIDDQKYVGYLIVGNQLRPLPIGSTLDADNGIFCWQLGPGFVGEYNFVFISDDGDRIKNKKNIRIRILPAYSIKSDN